MQRVLYDTSNHAVISRDDPMTFGIPEIKPSRPESSESNVFPAATPLQTFCQSAEPGAWRDLLGAACSASTHNDSSAISSFAIEPAGPLPG
jgi:hypothetical protein